MSEDLFGAFPRTSAEQWLEQITRDLKGGSPEELAWSPDGDLAFSPFVHAGHVSEPMAPLPGFGSWTISESFEVQNEAQSNRQILDALNGGVESLRISCGADMEWKTLLDGVSLSLIHIGLDFRQDAREGYNRFAAYAQAQPGLQDHHISVYGKALEVPANVRFCTFGRHGGPIIPDLTATLYQALDDDNWDPDLLVHRDLGLEIGGHYLIEIARIRACRILWQNIAQALRFDLSPEFGVEVRTSLAHGANDPHSDMIRSAFMGTCAVLGGADRIEISPASGDPASADFYRHVARNIPHLLRYESKFTEIPDPVAGAYYIDSVTKEIVDRTWLELKSRVKKSGR